MREESVGVAHFLEEHGPYVVLLHHVGDGDAGFQALVELPGGVGQAIEQPVLCGNVEGIHLDAGVSRDGNQASAACFAGAFDFHGLGSPDGVESPLVGPHATQSKANLLS